jgi:formyl-CoA transferase
VKRTEELDGVIGEWAATVSLDEALDVLAEAEVPSGRIYSIADIAADPHFAARGMFEKHKLGDREVVLPGIVPRLSATPGRTRWIGPRLGEHTDEVLSGLGIGAADIAGLRGRGVVA